jgi:hypothetical protein
MSEPIIDIGRDVHAETIAAAAVEGDAADAPSVSKNCCPRCRIRMDFYLANQP